MGLFNIKIQDEAFYAAAQEDCEITINKSDKTIAIQGVERVFHYEQHAIEDTLLEAGGVLPLYSKFGTKVFRHITAPKVKNGRTDCIKPQREEGIAW